MATSISSKPIVIIGGGIAGTTCAEYVTKFSQGDVDVIIITPKDVIKTAATVRTVTKHIQELAVNEQNKTAFERKYSNVVVTVDLVKEIDSVEKTVRTSKGEQISYSKLCICTGGKPTNIKENNPFVICMRDTDTVQELKNRLSTAKKVIIVGNGGIALELVYEIVGCEIIWCIKNDSIGNTFFDKGAATFLVPTLRENDEGESDEIKNTRKADQIIFKRKRHEMESFQDFYEDEKVLHGTALGPDWSSIQNFRGALEECRQRNVTVKYSCEVIQISSPLIGDKRKNDSNVYVKLSNGETIGADFVISATGVLPNAAVTLKGRNKFEVCNEGGLCVNDNMQTNITDIYAAGDVCSPSWEQSEKWFPMKLWTQGWQMGAFAGKCIAGHLEGTCEIPLDYCFELFTHATTFFGYKVCLLGAFNCQKLQTSECEILLRYTPGCEYIKVVLKDGKIQGCLLIGETDLEETFENLILNGLDVSFLGESLLDPNVDINDYFD